MQPKDEKASFSRSRLLFMSPKILVKMLKITTTAANIPRFAIYFALTSFFLVVGKLIA